jgi:predicted esterase
VSRVLYLSLDTLLKRKVFSQIPFVPITPFTNFSTLSSLFGCCILLALKKSKMKIFNSLFNLAAATILGVAAEPSPGCGKAPTKLINGLNTIDFNGVPRKFIVHLPENYDNRNPYRLIFAFHATGGTANDTAKSYYGLLRQGGSTSILISPQGQSPTAGGGKASGLISLVAKDLTGWWHTGGKFGQQDVEFVDKIVDAVDADLCIDTRLRFATGFSFGGVMSHSLACLRPEKFRAVSVQSGCGFDMVIDGMSKSNKGKAPGGTGPAAKPPGACKKTDSFSQANMGIDPSLFLNELLLGDKKPGGPFVCGKKAVPYMGVMGSCDGWIEYGRQGRDEFVENNGCKPQLPRIPIEGSKQRVQTIYECASDTPLVWTEFDGGHQPTREAEVDTWKFFSQFK